MSDDNYDALQDALGRDALYPVPNARDGNHILTYLNEENGHAAKGGKSASGRARRRGDIDGTGRVGEATPDSGEATSAASSGANETVVPHPRARNSG